MIEILWNFLPIFPLRLYNVDWRKGSIIAGWGGYSNVMCQLPVIWLQMEVPYLNPLTAKIWLLILSSCCYTLPCKLVTRIWCKIKIKLPDKFFYSHKPFARKLMDIMGRSYMLVTEVTITRMLNGNDNDNDSFQQERWRLPLVYQSKRLRLY